MYSPRAARRLPPRRLEFFLTHEKKVDGQDKLLVGKAALAELYAEVLGGSAPPTDLGQLESLGTFSFLLAPTQKTALDNATKALVCAGARKDATSASSSGGGSRGEGQGGQEGLAKG